MLQRGVAAIPKSVTPQRIQENINIFDFELDESDFKELWNLEGGEEARVCDFKAFGYVVLLKFGILILLSRIEDHPDFPIKP